MGCCHMCCTCIMLIIFVLVTVLTLYGIPTLLHTILSQQLSLVPGNIIYDAWSQGSYPILRRSYIFNIENPDDVNRGEKPIFNEIGPFVFSVGRKKSNVIADEFISYTDKVGAIFNETESQHLSLDDEVKILNVPLLSIYYWAHKNGSLEIVRKNKDIIFNEGYDLVLNVKVKNILYEGVKICDGVKASNTEVMQICEGIKTIKMVSKVGNTLLFALFKEKIYYEETYTVNSGMGDIKKVGQVVKMQNERTLAIWPTTGTCNAIDSTLGDVFPPFIKKTDEVEIFRPDICRKMTYFFKRQVPGSSKAFEFATFLEKVPQECFCYEEHGCYLHGVVDMHECWGPYMAMSLPNFYGAHEKYLTAVGNMKPNEEEHVSRITLDYYFGFLNKANFKFQYNMNLKKDLEFSNTEDILFPLLWIDEDTYIPGELNEFLVQVFYYYLFIVQAACYGVMGLFGILFLVLVLCKLCMVLWPKN